MPIMIDDILDDSSSKALTPHYFSKQLTAPVTNKKGISVTSSGHPSRLSFMTASRKHNKNGNTDEYTFPFLIEHVLGEYSSDRDIYYYTSDPLKSPVPTERIDPDNPEFITLYDVTHDATCGEHVRLAVRLSALGMYLNDTRDKVSGLKHDARVVYDFSLLMLKTKDGVQLDNPTMVTRKMAPGDCDKACHMFDTPEGFYAHVFHCFNDLGNTLHKNDGTVFHATTLDPKMMLENLIGIIDAARNLGNLQASFALDFDEVGGQGSAIKAFDSLTTHEIITRQAERWHNHTADIMNGFITNLASQIEAIENGVVNASVIGSVHDLTTMLEHIDDYPVPLDQYVRIANHIIASFDDIENRYPNGWFKDNRNEIMRTISASNLNILLVDILHQLDIKRSQLAAIPTPPAGYAIDPAYSSEQKKAIGSTEPLVMVQAGAGTGKTHSIMGRIKYLTDCGVDPKDILVISFTNAAADNVMERNPGVKAMTNASMVHQIYQANWPNQNLSTMDTIANSLDIYYPTDDDAYKFRRLVSACASKQGSNQELAALNNYVDDNFDKVMTMLDTIGQTSLELEIIACYQRITTLTMPDELVAKHLIIDEVQDNSIFEFIYALSYTIANDNSLFLVGDGSQTLYEFRAANPRALNTLEGSGVFSTFSLQTNYRSNQEILDYANVVLGEIEANQYAKLQLKANTITANDVAEFSKKVTLNPMPSTNARDVVDKLDDAVQNEMGDWINDRIGKGQQIAWLTYDRRNCAALQRICAQYYPQVKQASLVPERMTAQTIFSAFIKRYWNEIRFKPTQSIQLAIINAIYQKLPMMVRDVDKMRPAIDKQISGWHQESKARIDALQAQYANGEITSEEMFNSIVADMIQYEVNNNVIRQSVVSANNRQRKESQDINDAGFVFSTIHSAKGLEFDNTVVVINESALGGEEGKRMYYVALTRAKQSEYVIAYSKGVNMTMTKAYEQVLQARA